VKPIPAKREEPPASNSQLRSEARIAIPERTASQLKASTPHWFAEDEPGEDSQRHGTYNIAERYWYTRIGQGKKQHYGEPHPGMQQNLEPFDWRQRFARRSLCPVSNVSRSFVSPLPTLCWPAGYATTRSKIAYNRSSLTHRRAGVSKPSTTPVMVA
jgi:hypothetical protein